MIIRGNTVGTTTPRSNWNQNDPTKADYVIGHEAVDAAIAAAKKTVDDHIKEKANPHVVTAEQVGARPNTWMPTAQDVGARPDTWMPSAADVGAVTESQVSTMINEALGVIENGTY